MNRIRRPYRCPAGLSARASATLAVAAALAAWRLPRPAYTPVSDPAEKRGHDHDR
jgi:hypothetical protein